MNLRILVIDDEEQFLTNVRVKLENGLVENPWQARVEVHPLHSDVFSNPEALIAHVELLGTERWDALLVDVNLFGEKPKTLAGLMLPIELVRVFRKQNHAAVALVFSGNIQDHLRELFQAQDTNEVNVKRQVEKHVRSIISLGILDFSQKNRVADDAIGRLLQPPLILRLEREFLRTPSVVVETSCLAALGIAAEGEKVTFAILAGFLRHPGAQGEMVARVASEYGVAALADLYA